MCYPLSLHDALPISGTRRARRGTSTSTSGPPRWPSPSPSRTSSRSSRSEEHTSELQSLAYLVCRLLLEKKKTESEIVGHTTVIFAAGHETSSNGLTL